MQSSVDNSRPRQKQGFFGQNGSFTKVSNRLFSQGRFLTAEAKVLYITLLSYRNEVTLDCFPSYEKISERSNLSRPAIAKAIAELERFGWIDKWRRYNKSTEYFIQWPGGKDDVLGEPCPSKAQAEQWRRERSRKRYQPQQSRTLAAQPEVEPDAPDDIPF
jgi:hypothetical protein